jgi:hypothetical protein
MIEAGEQPIGKVLKALESLEDGAIYKLITPFEPAPLIDKASDKGLEVWFRSHGSTEYHTYFCKLRQ